MAAQASDSPTASANLQELQLFPEEGPATLLPELPPELRNVARLLEKAFHDSAQLPGAFSNFCAAAYVKPEWAGAASEYLTTLFEEKEDLLAEMTRVPDLIIELGSGHYSLTFMVASRWAAKADLARLTRLAEALIATQSKMNTPEVVDLMMALTTSLAISRYPRAEHLLLAAESHVTEEQQESLAEARLWLGAGRIVRGCTQEARDLWDKRLRRPRVEWTWESPEECAALSQLSECLDTHDPAAGLFRAVVPTCWWDLMVVCERERAELESALSGARITARQQPEPHQGSSPKTVVRQPIIIWRGIPFFFGGLVGAWALLLGLKFSSYDLVRQPAESPTITFKPAETETNPSESNHPNAVWRREQAAQILTEMPELRAVAEKIGLGDWPQYEHLLKGLTLDFPKDDFRYQKLLLLLHLDPPSNEEIRKQVPLMLAEMRQDSTVIELWEKLVYPGSPNAADIQNAALRTQHDKKEAWSPTQRALLSRIGASSVKAP